MKDSDFEKFFEKLWNFLVVQFEFVEETARYNHVPAPYGNAHVAIYLAIFAEGIALGVGGLAFWGLRELIRRWYAKATRPKYYPQEKARRRRLAAERRKIRQRRTLNPPPTAEALRAQYAKVRRNPAEMIRFGSMLCDLEAYVDNSLIRDEGGAIVGRRSGIKGWLAEHCPEMHRHYKTVIRYKALAVKFRQAVGLADPHPAAEALEETENETTGRKVENNAFYDGAAAECDAGRGEVETTVRKSGESAFYARAMEILGEAGMSEAGLIAALDLRLDPDSAVEAPVSGKRYSGLRILGA